LTIKQAFLLFFAVIIVLLGIGLIATAIYNTAQGKPTTYDPTVKI
jgi:hypothetical protein